MRLGITAGVLVGLVAAFPCAATADPLPDNNYAIDLFQGPILAPLRVLGIAGAYAGYAEGIEGFVSNAAAPAVRAPSSVRNVDVDISASISIPLTLFENNDFDNSGDLDYDYSNFLYLTGGVQVQVGPVGAGFIGELQRYSIAGSDDKTSTVTVGKYHALGAVNVLGGQASVGAGVRAVTMGISAPDATLPILGVAPELGVLVRPDWLPFRVGATFRFPVSGAAVANLGKADENGVRKLGGFVLPRAVVLPWEIEVGAALQAGPRPLNPSWINPNAEEAPLEARIARQRGHRTILRAVAEARALPEDRAELRRAAAFAERAIRLHEDAWLVREERYLRDQRTGRAESWPRPHILFTTSMLVSGPVSDGVSIERFLAQEIAGADKGKVIGSSGASVNFSPRLGIEAEPVEDHVLTRVGSYYEPNRFARVGRQHFTFGGDIRLFSTTIFGLVPKVTYTLRSAMDFAPRYSSVSVSLGVWH